MKLTIAKRPVVAVGSVGWAALVGKFRRIFYERI
jgi:hypothetical protein